MNLVQHYVMVAVRHVWRHKSFSAINVIGLTLGITCCMFIYLWVTDERSVDNFHEKSDRLYNVYMRTVSPNGVTGAMNTPRMVAGPEKMRYIMPVIEDAPKTIPDVEAVA